MNPYILAFLSGFIIGIGALFPSNPYTRFIMCTVGGLMTYATGRLITINRDQRKVRRPVYRVSVPKKIKLPKYNDF